MTKEDRQEFKRLVYTILEQEYGLKKPLANASRYVSAGLAAHRLGIDRQTFLNWRKHPQLQKLIIQFTHGTGRYAAYDVESLRQNLIEKGPMFELRSDMVELLKSKSKKSKKKKSLQQKTKTAYEQYLNKDGF